MSTPHRYPNPLIGNGQSSVARSFNPNFTRAQTTQLFTILAMSSPVCCHQFFFCIRFWIILTSHCLYCWCILAIIPARCARGGHHNRHSSKHLVKLLPQQLVYQSTSIHPVFGFVKRGCECVLKNRKTPSSPLMSPSSQCWLSTAPSRAWLRSFMSQKCFE